MVYRLGWIAGALGIVLALARAGRLLRSSTEGLPWQTIMIAAVVLGAAITWAAVAYRLKGRWVALANLAAVSLMVFRIAVPETTWFVFPTAASLPALGEALTLAREVIRGGVAPVIPLSGLVAILAVVFWSLGALLAWGLLADRPYVAVLSPLVVYLEFAVMDRRPGGLWGTAFMLVIGLALLSVALDQRRTGTGPLTSQATRLTLARTGPSLGVIAIAAIVVVSLTAGRAIADLVPRSGYLDWRANTGLTGEYFGGVSYNPFVGIRQSLVSSSNVPVFAAEVEGPLDGRSISWRLVTLDSFDGSQWHIGRGTRIRSVDEIDRYEAASTAFEGPTARMRADVTIAALQMDWLPAPYSPVALASSDSAIERGLRVKQDDASLRFDALTFRGMTYTVVSDVPQPDLDVLALRPDGSPSAMFAGAIRAGEYPAPLTGSAPTPRDLPDADHFLLLPEGLDPGITTLARRQVAGLETDFERAMALESFFRAPGTFRYSTDITPGHGADDLAAWLLDAESQNHRVGYCEQFATAMAVMARAVGIPSRVVLGFTPGSFDDDGRIVVRARNAHAWVELWMPSQGWVQFDPTPRGDGINPPTLDRIPFDVARYLEVAPGQTTPPGGAGPLPPEIFFDEPEPVVPTTSPPLPEDTGGTWWTVDIPLAPAALILSALALVAAVPVAKLVRRRRRLRRLDDGDVAAAWAEIVDRLSDLGDRPLPAATPAEIARGASPALAPLAEVYAEATYGPPGPVPPGRVVVAVRSMEAAEHQLTGRYSPARRLAAHYMLTSLLPPRWRNRRRPQR